MAKIAMNSTTTRYCNIVSDIKIAKQVGYEAVELMAEKLFRYEDAGYDVSSLRPLLGDMKVVAIGALQNLERQGDGYEEYLKEVHHYCSVAQKLGAGMVQMCSGPSDVQTVKDFRAGKIAPGDTRYLGTLGKSEEEVLEIAAANIAAAADIAAEYGVVLYLEPLAWTPFGKIAQALKVIDYAGKKNVGVVIDLWHLWTLGESPEFVASLDKDVIKIVHLCDGLEYDRSTVPDQEILRDVWIGAGDIPIGRYIKAIKATGYDGWYSTETFCRKGYEKDPVEAAQALKLTYEYLLD